MLELICDPPARAKTADPFLQSIRYADGETLVGQARWHTTCDVSEGVAEILYLTVSPSYRRRGNGRRLMEAVTAQATEYFKCRKSRLRRLWIPVNQKSQVIARSFLMQFGFNHVGTVQELLKDEDLLIYMRTFD
jgi:GNAT superfamily N-acetyltransferase